MGFFGLRKKERVIDLGVRYRKQQEQVAAMKEEMEQTSSDQSVSSEGMSFLANLANSASSSQKDTGAYAELGGSVDERKRKLAKRLMELTDRLENLSNEIYHLQQRIEVLERKAGVGSY